MKTSFKILLMITVATGLLWPCFGYMYDPKGTTSGWYMITLVIEVLTVFGYLLFSKPIKN